MSAYRFRLAGPGRRIVSIEADDFTAAQNELHRRMRHDAPDDEWIPEYEEWRHGGWYVTNLRYPSGACGCVSRNFTDRRWRIVCHPLPFDEQPTYPSRDAAARAERSLVRA